MQIETSYAPSEMKIVGVKEKRFPRFKTENPQILHEPRRVLNSSVDWCVSITVETSSWCPFYNTQPIIEPTLEKIAKRLLLTLAFGRNLRPLLLLQTLSNKNLSNHFSQFPAQGNSGWRRPGTSSAVGARNPDSTEGMAGANRARGNNGFHG